MDKSHVKDLLTRPRMSSAIPKSDFLSTGCTLLNLACSGTIYGGLTKGRYFWMVGDSSSGKTFLTLTCLAEASINPEFDEYDLIFDNAEDGALMEVEKYFGPRLAERLQPPRKDEDGPIYSETIEDFYFHLDDRLELVEKGKAPPFIYLIDSMDALSSEYEGKKFKETKKAVRASKKAKGDYGDGKAKTNSRWIRGINSRLRKTRSILIVLSQTRDNIDAGLFEPKKTSAGGRALKFYAGWQLWSSIKARIKKTVNGKDRQTGIICRLAIKKNRLTGKEWTVDVPLYWSTGFDDVGACIDFLVEEKHWDKSSSGIIKATDFDIEMQREKLVKHIEDNDMEFDLRDLTAEVFQRVVDACRVERKPRYQ